MSIGRIFAAKVSSGFKNFVKKPLEVFNISAFLQTQILMLPVLIKFYEENGLTIGDYFLFQGIFSITALMFEVPAGYIGDIFPRRNVLIFSYGLFLARLVLWSLFGGYWIVLAGEILYSMSKAFYSGVADGYVYDYLKSRGETKKMLRGYGRLNFWMSIGTAFASLCGPFLYKKYGFPVLIAIEMILNTLAVGLLFLLPKVPSARQLKSSLTAKYRELIHITYDTLTNRQLVYYILYSGALAATTMVFVWGFQPIMNAVGLPVYLFGVVYFFNHLFRAGSAILLQKTLAFVSLKKLGKLNYVLYLLSFIGVMVSVRIESPLFTLAILIFVCFAIGGQLSFTLASIARLHSLVPSNVRSTVSSVNYLVSRAMAGLLMITMKFLLDGISLTASFGVFMALFMFSIFPLMRLLRLPNETVQTLQEATADQPRSLQFPVLRKKEA